MRLLPGHAPQLREFTLPGLTSLNGDVGAGIYMADCCSKCKADQ